MGNNNKKIKVRQKYNLTFPIIIVITAFIILYIYDINMLFLFVGIIGFMSLTISQMVFKRW